ncbi:MAG: hypothetical protein HYY40_01510 [Bacteroidetes bacterium]|nr:hypothetical protein [Bacteroidota bacterium]
MNTQPFTKTMDQYQEAFRSMYEFYTNTSLSLLEAYNKQLSTAFEYYSKGVESTLKNKIKQNFRISVDAIKENFGSYRNTLNTTFGLSKEIINKFFVTYPAEDTFKPVSPVLVDSVLKIFNKQAELTRDFGYQFISILNKEFILSNNDFDSYSSKYNELIKEIIENSQESINKVLDSSNLEPELTEKNTRKLIDTINRQFDILADANVAFLDELLKTVKISDLSPNGGEKEPDVKSS